MAKVLQPMLLHHISHYQSLYLADAWQTAVAVL
jgi:hypothetical protein